MSLFVRLSGDLPSFEKSFWRNLVAIAFAIYAIEKNHISYRLENPKNLKYLFIRAIGGTIGGIWGHMMNRKVLRACDDLIRQIEE